MRVLAIDPGLTRCGLGVVEGRVGTPLQMLNVEVVRTPSEMPIELRLLAIAEQAQLALSRWQPDVLAVERVFSQHNVRSAISTGQAAAVVMLEAARAGVPVVSHTPTEVKAAVSGHGGADKDQVGAMVARLLRLAEPPKPADAADALALAICHIWRTPLSHRTSEVLR